MKNRHIIRIVSCLFLLQLTGGCHLLPDEKLSMERMPYEGNELRMDGYYYMYSDTKRIIVKYLFRNGIILTAYFFSTINLNDVEKEMIQEYELLQKDKSRWGIFSVNRNTIKTEEWSTSVGGGLPTFKCVGITENDTTFRITKYIDNGKEYPRDYTYHFRKFSSKPDSTNRFIP